MSQENIEQNGYITEGEYAKIRNLDGQSKTDLSSELQELKLKNEKLTRQEQSLNDQIQNYIDKSITAPSDYEQMQEDLAILEDSKEKEIVETIESFLVELDALKQNCENTGEPESGVAIDESMPDKTESEQQQETLRLPTDIAFTASNLKDIFDRVISPLEETSDQYKNKLISFYIKVLLTPTPVIGNNTVLSELPVYINEKERKSCMNNFLKLIKTDKQYLGVTPDVQMKNYTMLTQASLGIDTIEIPEDLKNYMALKTVQEARFGANEVPRSNLQRTAKSLVGQFLPAIEGAMDMAFADYKDEDKPRSITEMLSNESYLKTLSEKGGAYGKILSYIGPLMSMGLSFLFPKSKDPRSEIKYETFGLKNDQIESYKSMVNTYKKVLDDGIELDDQFANTSLNNKIKNTFGVEVEIDVPTIQTQMKENINHINPLLLKHLITSIDPKESLGEYIDIKVDGGFEFKEGIDKNKLSNELVDKFLKNPQMYEHMKQYVKPDAFKDKDGNMLTSRDKGREIVGAMFSYFFKVNAGIDGYFNGTINEQLNPKPPKKKQETPATTTEVVETPTQQDQKFEVSLGNSQISIMKNKDSYSVGTQSLIFDQGGKTLYQGEDGILYEIAKTLSTDGKETFKSTESSLQTILKQNEISSTEQEATKLPKLKALGNLFFNEDKTQSTQLFTMLFESLKTGNFDQNNLSFLDKNGKIAGTTITEIFEQKLGIKGLVFKEIKDSFNKKNNVIIVEGMMGPLKEPIKYAISNEGRTTTSGTKTETSFIIPYQETSQTPLPVISQGANTPSSEAVDESDE